MMVSVCDGDVCVMVSVCVMMVSVCVMVSMIFL